MHKLSEKISKSDKLLSTSEWLFHDNYAGWICEL